VGLERTPAAPTRRSSHPCSGARSLPEPQQLEPPVFFLRPPLSGTSYNISAILFFRLFVERRPATVYPLLFVGALLIGSFPFLPISPIHHPSLSIYLYLQASKVRAYSPKWFRSYCSVFVLGARDICVCAYREDDFEPYPSLAVCL
jgi:hypothetical protein